MSLLSLQESNYEVSFLIRNLVLKEFFSNLSEFQFFTCRYTGHWLTISTSQLIILSKSGVLVFCFHVELCLNA